MKDLIVQTEVWIAAEQARVWQAITEPEQLAQWLLAPFLGATLSRDDAGKLCIGMGPMSVPVAMMHILDAPKQVSIESFPDERTQVTFILQPHEGGTQVRVNMSGDALTEAARNEIREPSRVGWEKALANLSAFVGGAALPHPEGYVASLFGYRREYQQRYAVERSVWIAAPRERVWRALCDPAQVQQWFSPNVAWRLTKLEVGGVLSVVDAETGADTHPNVIDVLEPPSRLVLRTVPEQPGGAYDVTAYALIEKNGGTRLILTHSGYALMPDDARHQSMEQNAFGFGMMLENLHAFVVGQALPYPQGF